MTLEALKVYTERPLSLREAVALQNDKSTLLSVLLTSLKKKLFFSQQIASYSVSWGKVHSYHSEFFHKPQGLSQHQSLSVTDSVGSAHTVSRPYAVVGLGGDGFHAVGVPDDQVGVGSHSDAALPGVKVEDFGCIGAGHGHKLVLVHLPCDLKGTTHARTHQTQVRQWKAAARLSYESEHTFDRYNLDGPEGIMLSEPISSGHILHFIIQTFSK